MPRMYEIPAAFDHAVKRAKDGRYTVTTRDFIDELRKLNHHFGPKEANAWIAFYRGGWRLYDEGEQNFNVYTKFNPHSR
ncbi:DNA polymerase V [Acerihabitans arboris]|uniref:DNA polymerase V n=1 Tax=Acerihabitans arboris TaxID=2691583 RepID=UPI0015B72EC8|nr:DNA polymerase V [Acerihabitans arboris]